MFYQRLKVCDSRIAGILQRFFSRLTANMQSFKRRAISMEITFIRLNDEIYLEFN